MKNNSRKIGIVTLLGNYNYGNRLQNYAVEKMVEELGYVPVTLRYEKKQERKLVASQIKNFLKYFVAFCPGIYGNCSRRYLNFKRFNHKFLHIIKIKDLFEINEKYDAFFVGSDQVWNPNEISDLMFLKFAEPNKRFSIAASFGTSILPDNLEEIYKEGLENMNAISVREQMGKNS